MNLTTFITNNRLILTELLNKVHIFRSYCTPSSIANRRRHHHSLYQMAPFLQPTAQNRKC